MKKPATPLESLIAPCGLNCAACSRYLAYLHNLKRSQCKGCRPENKKCTYLLKKCAGTEISSGGTASAPFCFECGHYPCVQIDRLDRRYRKSYGVSVKDNLEAIKARGVSAFVDEQCRKYSCGRCGETISIHNRKCFICDQITRLVEKKRGHTE